MVFSSPKESGARNGIILRHRSAAAGVISYAETILIAARTRNHALFLLALQWLRPPRKSIFRRGCSIFGCCMTPDRLVTEPSASSPASDHPPQANCKCMSANGEGGTSSDDNHKPFCSMVTAARVTLTIPTRRSRFCFSWSNICISRNNPTYC